MKNTFLVALALLCLSAGPADFAAAQGADIDALLEKANRGDASAQFALGAMYLFGRGVAQDDRETSWRKGRPHHETEL